MNARQLKCPKCQQALAVATTAPRVRCPACQTVLQLPKSPAPAASPLPSATTRSFPNRPASPTAPPTFQPPGPPAPNQAPRDAPEDRRKAVLLWLALGGIFGLLAIAVLVGGIGWMLLAPASRGDQVARAEVAPPSTTAAAPLASTNPPAEWRTAEVLGVSVRVPPGAVDRKQLEQGVAYRVLSAATSSRYTVLILTGAPEKNAAAAGAAAGLSGNPWTAGCGSDWQPHTRGGREGQASGDPLAGCRTEVYPFDEGWVVLHYQAFSKQPAATRPQRDVQEDEASRDRPRAFFDSAVLPARLPTEFASYSTRPLVTRMDESQKRALYRMYRQAADQAEKSPKLPKGYTRDRFAGMMEGILENEIQKILALYDVSREQLDAIVAEGEGRGW